MDRVRFGRALGYGARHAAKSLKSAMEAASAPSPRSPARPPTPQPVVSRPAQPTASRVAQPVGQTMRTVATSGKHARALGRSVWSPLARFSSVVWLQVTGSFFALLALFLSEWLWKQRAMIGRPLNLQTAQSFYVPLLACIVFTYFAISNFVRAHLRERR